MWRPQRCITPSAVLLFFVSQASCTAHLDHVDHVRCTRGTPELLTWSMWVHVGSGTGSPADEYQRACAPHNGSVQPSRSSFVKDKWDSGSRLGSRCCSSVNVLGSSHAQAEDSRHPAGYPVLAIAVDKVFCCQTWCATCRPSVFAYRIMIRVTEITICRR